MWHITNKFSVSVAKLVSLHCRGAHCSIPTFLVAVVWFCSGSLILIRVRSSSLDWEILPDILKNSTCAQGSDLHWDWNSFFWFFPFFVSVVYWNVSFVVCCWGLGSGVIWIWNPKLKASWGCRNCAQTDLFKCSCICQSGFVNVRNFWWNWASEHGRLIISTLNI